MNDDQLGRELRAALLEDDPGAVPVRLSGRVAGIPDEVVERRGFGSLRRLETIAAVVVVGALVAASLYLRGSSAGEAPSASPSASPNSTASGALPTGTPGATLLPTRSAQPVTHWTGLEWSAPSVIPGAEGINDIAYYNGQFIAAGRTGTINSSGGQLPVAIWRSGNGTAWTQVSLDAAMFDNANIQGVVASDTLGMIAWGTAGDPVCNGVGEGLTCGPLPVAIWTSPNGIDWSRAGDVASLKDATLNQVAYGTLGFVAVGNTGFDRPGIWVSSDGSKWERLTLDPSVFAQAHFSSISYTVDGYVIGGATGGTAPVSGGVQLPDTGVAAAWLFDGRTWARATVNRTNGDGTDLGSIAVGANGMVAVGTSSGGSGAVPIGWASTDGKVWSPIPVGGDYAGAPSPKPGVPMLPSDQVMGDGLRLIALGTDSSGLRMWDSDDGVTWTLLEYSGATGTIPNRPDAAPSQAYAFPVPGGLIVMAVPSKIGAEIPVWMATAQP